MPKYLIDLLTQPGIPPYVAELLEKPGALPAAILLASALAALLVQQFVVRTLAALFSKTETDLDDAILELLRRPLFFSILLYGISVAVSTTKATPQVIYVVDGLLRTLAVWIWTVASFRVSLALVGALGAKAKEGSLVQPRTVPIFDMLLKILVLGGAIYFTFLAWKIDVTAWLASAGIIGVAVGFAAKDTLANLFSGFFILADAPYKLGDWIVLDNQLRGRVTHIGLRSTRILTRDDVEITVPNALIGNSKIINEMGGPEIKQRIRTSVSVAYGTDLDRVREVLESVPKGVELVCDTPTPQVRFRRFGPSGMEFDLLVWIEEAGRRGFVIDRLNSGIYAAFRSAGIEVPYSKQEIFIKELPSSLVKSESKRDAREVLNDAG